MDGEPLTLVVLVWIAVAALTAAVAGRTWGHLRRAVQSPAARRQPAVVRDWAWTTTTVAGCLTVVALCNAAAGLVALDRIAAPPVPPGRTDAGALVVPAIFIASSLVKLYAAWRLDAGYRRVLAAAVTRRRAKEVSS